MHGSCDGGQRAQARAERLHRGARVHDPRPCPGDRRGGGAEMSQRSSRRPAPVEPNEVEAAPPWGRQAWIALLVMGALIAAVIGAGWLVSKALEPQVPAAPANCPASTEIGPHQFIGPQPMCITAKQKLQATISTARGDIVVQLAPEVAPVTVNNFVVLAIHG